MITDIKGRRSAAKAAPAAIPSSAQRAQAFGAQMRAQSVERDGKTFVQLDGYASTVEQPYVMYDMFGEYTEVVDARAFDKTLSATPDVAFLLNHRGMTMARTKNGTLELAADATGLRSVAFLNPERTDVRDLVHAIDDGDVDEMSFAFTITRGQWSPDYMEYRILEVDLDRGDVSAVNYGANPNTSIAARAKQALESVEDLPVPVLRELAERAGKRLDVVDPAPAARGGLTSMRVIGDGDAPEVVIPLKRKQRTGPGLAALRFELDR